MFEEEDRDEDDKRAAARWAYELMHDPAGFVVLDTETTGLGDDAEACQIAVIDQAGTVLLDTLVRPTVPIGEGAIAVHGITNEMVASAPAFADVLPKLREVTRGRTLVIYNAEYDLRVLDHTSVQHEIVTGENLGIMVGPAQCAMLRYAAFHGEWSDYRGDYRWQKLADACAQQGVEVVDAPAHSALGDCLRTLGVIKAMADWYAQEIEEVPASSRPDAAN